MLEVTVRKLNPQMSVEAVPVGKKILVEYDRGLAERRG